jgi:nucleotide-binding universal stress UspA family protein
MNLKDILAAVMTLEHDEAALKAAQMIAARFESHAAALVVAVRAGSEFFHEPPPLSKVLEGIIAGDQSRAALERDKIADWIERASVRFETHDVVVERALNQRQALAHARRADLTVLTRPPMPQRAHDALFEHVLFGSGRPVLAMPSAWRRDTLWDRILIAWDAGREASRAVADSLPFLQMAQLVVVATVDALPSDRGHGPAPGCGLAAHLAHHGVRAEVSNIDGLSRSEGAALLDQAWAMDADMIVMGGYGRSRVSEFIFGGVTRELSTAPQFPLFLSH